MTQEKKYTFTQWVKILTMIGCTIAATANITRNVGLLVFKGNTWYNGVMIAIENRKNMDSMQNILIRNQANEMMNLNNKVERIDLRITNCELDINRLTLITKPR